MTIYEKIKSLNLPLGKYVVLAGSALEGYGIRKAGDIDIAVTSDIYRKLKDAGWEEIVKPSGIKVLRNEEFEVGKDNWCYGDYVTSLEYLIRGATIIEEVPFVALEEIVKFKTAFNREKDRKDIELIKDYIKKEKNVI